MKEVRFEFGKNWESFSQLVQEENILEAERRLKSLIGTDCLQGKTFLDIGCGSGLHSLAALRLGASKVVAIDLDPNSVATTRAVLEKFWGEGRYTVQERSVLDLDPREGERFDIVYSWGVLHHTGQMNKAIQIACELVKPGGLFVVALYGKTRYCGLWKIIKKWYVNATAEKKLWAERMYVRLFRGYLLLRGKRLSTHIANYRQKRGMDFYHDVRDWIGGYPYESITPEELHSLVAKFAFKPVKQNVKRRSGLFGSGNDEYVFQRAQEP